MTTSEFRLNACNSPLKQFLVSFYAAYRTFFSKVIKEKGLSATLKEYIFSKKYNFTEGRDASTQPVMSARFLGALFHAFIHVGYGAEFGISGMVVEGERHDTSL